MYKLVETTRFRKDLKKILKQSRSDFDMAMNVLEVLEAHGVEGISGKMRPHRLKGRYRNNWECHIKPDLLIIWIQANEEGAKSPLPNPSPRGRG